MHELVIYKLNKNNSKSFLKDINTIFNKNSVTLK